MNRCAMDTHRVMVTGWPEKYTNMLRSTNGRATNVHRVVTAQSKKINNLFSYQGAPPILP